MGQLTVGFSWYQTDHHSLIRTHALRIRRPYEWTPHNSFPIATLPFLFFLLLDAAVTGPQDEINGHFHMLRKPSLKTGLCFFFFCHETLVQERLIDMMTRRTGIQPSSFYNQKELLQPPSLCHSLLGKCLGAPQLSGGASFSSPISPFELREEFQECVEGKKLKIFGALFLLLLG